MPKAGPLRCSRMIRNASPNLMTLPPCRIRPTTMIPNDMLTMQHGADAHDDHDAEQDAFAPT